MEELVLAAACSYGLWAAFLCFLPAATLGRTLQHRRKLCSSLWLRAKQCMRRSRNKGKMIDQSLIAFEAKVEQIALERFRARAYRLVELAVLWVHPVVSIFYTIAAFKKVGSAPELVAYSSYVILVPVQVLSVVFYLWPATITRAKCRIGYSAIVLRELLIVLYPAIGPSGVPIEVTITTSMLMRFWMAITLQDSVFIIVLHLVLVPLHILAAALQHVISPGNPEAVAAQFIGAEVLVSLVVCVATISAEAGCKAGIRAEVEARRSKEYERGADALLSGMCEAVVHLTPTLDISRDCPRLATLLLRHPRWCDPSRLGAEPIKFLELMPDEEDKKAFEAFIHRPCDEFAQTLHTTLRDSHCLPVRVQLFHTRIMDDDGEEIHLVGVRDSGEERNAPAAFIEPGLDAVDLRVAASTAMDETAHTKAVLSAANMKSAIRKGTCLSSISEDCRSDELSNLSSPHLCSKGPTDELKVWVYFVGGTNMKMLKCTPSFFSLLGPKSLDVDNFNELVLGQKRFVQDVQRISNELWYHENVQTIDVVMASRVHGPLHLIGCVSTEDSTGSEHSEQETEDGMVLVFKFTSWSRVTFKRKNASTTSHRSKRRWLIML